MAAVALAMSSNASNSASFLHPLRYNCFCRASRRFARIQMDFSYKFNKVDDASSRAIDARRMRANKTNKRKQCSLMCLATAGS